MMNGDGHVLTVEGGSFNRRFLVATASMSCDKALHVLSRVQEEEEDDDFTLFERSDSGGWRVIEDVD